MRALLAVLLVGSLMVPTALPVASAEHRDTPVEPSRVVAEVFRDVLLQVADTINVTREKVGQDDPLIRKATDSWKRASQAHNAGNQWLTLSHLMEAVTAAQRADIEHDTRGSSDPDSAFFSRTEAAWNEGRGWITQVHERMLDLQSLGVDLWMLDHTVLAADILAQGERIFRGWSAVAQGWEDGQRADQAKNGLVGFTFGPILYADVADQLITKALRQAPDEPVGPVVGNATLQGVMEQLNPLVRNASVSFDRDMNNIISGNMASGEWLAALGAATAWGRNQASAAVQHTMGESEDEQFDPEAVVQRLGDILADSTVLEAAEDLGTPASHIRYSLAEADGILHVTEQTVEEGNATLRTSLEAAQGLGAASAAHMSVAILLLAAGEDPPKEVVFLPVDTASLDLDKPEDQGAETTADEASLLGSTWFWVVLAALVGVGAFVINRRDP